MTIPTKPKLKIVKPRLKLTSEQLADMVEEATVDAYGPSEQVSGFFTMMEEHLELPFTTLVLGVEVTVRRIELTGHDDIVAICERGNALQRIAIRDLPLPARLPKGAEWIEAYRQWRGDS
jgi:hypothetical protein